MPAAEYHTYVKKLLQASRRADAGATLAQREANNARVGRLYVHGLKIAIEYPKGSVRRGHSKDGSIWTRAVRNPYGYINRTVSADGEHLDVWIGDHLDSQLVFTFEFLTSRGDHDEIKAVIGAKNLDEAKKVIANNYPDNFVEERVGEIRGFFFPEFKKFLQTSGIMKKGLKKQADCDLDRFTCPHCRSENAFNGNPKTGHRFRGGARCCDCNKFFSCVKLTPLEHYEEKGAEDITTAILRIAGYRD